MMAGLGAGEDLAFSSILSFTRKSVSDFKANTDVALLVWMPDKSLTLQGGEGCCGVKWALVEVLKANLLSFLEEHVFIPGILLITKEAVDGRGPSIRICELHEDSTLGIFRCFARKMLNDKGLTLEQL